MSTDHDAARTAPAEPARVEAARAEAASRWVALLSLVLAVWVVISPMTLDYPLTVPGRQARLWASGVGLVVGILAAARLRVPVRTPRSAMALVPAAMVLTAVPFLAIGPRPQPEMGAAWWDLLLCGIALLILSVIGLVRLAGAGGFRRTRERE